MPKVTSHPAEQIVLRPASKLKAWLPTRLILLGATFLAISAPCAERVSRAMTIESHRPAYWALIRDDGSVTSVTMQPGVLPLDMNNGNSIKGETGDFKPVTYRFSKGILSRRTLQKIEKIYTVPRIRTVPIVSSGGDWMIAESFQAGSHTPKYRYEMLGRVVRTQYILDSHGRVVRIADIGWQTDVSDPRRSGDIRASYGVHATWIRIFDVNAKGGLNLVAAARVADTRERRPDDSPPAEDKLIFSNLSGQQTWPDQRHFEAALGLDLTAKAIALSGKERGEAGTAVSTQIATP